MPPVAVSPTPGPPPASRDVRQVTAPPWLVVAGGIAAALIVGVTLERSVPIGLAIVGACLFLPLVVISLPLALAAWIPIAWNEFSHVFNKAPLAGVLLLLVAWIGTRGVRGALVVPDRSVRAARLALVLLLVWVTFSISWASDRPDAWSGVKQWYVVAVVFLLISTVGSTPARVRLIMFAFVLGALVSIVIGLTGKGVTTTANAIDLASRERFAGGAGDPNYLAAGLVPAIALGLGLIRFVRDPLLRLGLVATVVALVTALLATESRGGLIAAALATVTALVLARERRAQKAILGICLIVSAVAVFSLVSPATGDHLRTFDASGTGRTDLWRVALRMASAHPLAGVGVNGFAHESQHYVRQPGTLTYVRFIVDRPAATHNVYLQQLAETGLVGLLLLLAVCGACLAACQTAAARFRAGGDRAMEALAQATTVSMVGLLAASFFISNATDQRFWMVLALGPALLASCAEGRPPAQFDSTSR
jgi:O-antigen ligase